MKTLTPAINKFNNLLYYLENLKPKETNVRVYPKESSQNVTIYYESINLDSLDRTNWKINLIAIIGKGYTDSNLSLTSVAQEVAKNEKSVSKFLQDEYGLSFKQYLNNIRLEEAKRLIGINELSLKEIAYMVGYGSSNHFTRVFKQYLNVTPTEYRNKISNETFSII